MKNPLSLKVLLNHPGFTPNLLLALNQRQKNNRVNAKEQIGMLGGMALGAGLMYFLDPNRGKRRRALVRDQIAHAFNQTGAALEITSRDISHRAYGLWAETSGLLRREEASDEVVLARVRSRLGRLVSHPHSIEATIKQGQVHLKGPVLAHEVKALLGGIAKVRGVNEVTHQLEIHEDGSRVPGLQGGRPRLTSNFELLQSNWSPTARLLTGLSAGVLTTYGLGRRDLLGMALGTAGLGLLIRSLTNLDVKRLTGIGSGHRAIDVHKTINIAAPIERVFEFWSNYQNFPRFMSNIQEVQAEGKDRSHWVVRGPAGISLEWDAVVTALEPNRLLAWESEPGAIIQNAGVIHFHATSETSTQVDINLSYNPPAGAIGHLAAKLFGADPKSEMNADLLRMKTLIETGIPPHDAAQPGALGEQVYTH